jgi:four helix bundle protein
MFDHEKLKVYQLSLEFVGWTSDLLDKVPKKINACDHLEAASTSIVLNIAEGNGRYTANDRCRFFDIARGSALECSASLDVLVNKKVFSNNEILPGKRMLYEIVSMLIGLIKSNSDRVHEPEINYGINTL